MAAERAADPGVIARNLRHALASYARSSDGGVVRESAGMTLVDSGVGYAVFNSAILLQRGADVAALLEEAGEFFRGRGRPWSCWTVGRLPEAAARRQRLRLIADHQGMVAEALIPPRRELPALEIRRVSDGQTRGDFVTICSMAFGLPAGVARQIQFALKLLF